MSTSPYPNEALRKKLIVAGIPETEHNIESLAARIPEDFSASSLRNASPDILAELLLYFIAKGMLALPLASDKALLNLPWGSHVCQFFNTKEDLVKLLVPFFKQGMERNEAGVWLVGDLTIEEARTALAVAVPDLGRYLAKGQMQIRHYSQFYTNPNGTVKAAVQLSEGIADMEASMRAQGFAGLRASGSVSWINNEESMTRFMDYETKVNHVIQNSRIMAVCTYPAKAASLCRCRELIHNHDKFFVKRGEWVHDKSREAEQIETVFASLVRA